MPFPAEIEHEAEYPLDEHDRLTPALHDPELVELLPVVFEPLVHLLPTLTLNEEAFPSPLVPFDDGIIILYLIDPI
jgi:hypothetical protein